VKCRVFRFPHSSIPIPHLRLGSVSAPFAGRQAENPLATTLEIIQPMKWLGSGEGREMLGEANGMVPNQQVVRQAQVSQSQMVGGSGDARVRAQDDAMVGYIYQRPQDPQWSHHNLVQGHGDGVMYQELRAPQPMQDIHPRNGPNVDFNKTEMTQEIPCGCSANFSSATSPSSVYLLIHLLQIN